MTVNLYWFLPTHGDGRTIARRSATGGPSGVREMQRAPELNYLSQVCGAVEQLGFAGMLVPAGLFCEDPWLVTAALAERTSTVKFMVAIRPSLLSPLLAAQMAATAQRLSGDRLLLNVVSGGDRDEQARYGSWLSHDERYEQSSEFLAILRATWAGRPVDFGGSYFDVKGALLTRPPRTPPQVFVGGSSEPAQRVAAEHAEVYLAWGETPGELTEIFAKTTELAQSFGRRIALGTRFHVISRDTAAEAWKVADELIEGVDPKLVAQAGARSRRSESEGQRRMAKLHGGRPDRLVVHPNVWAGYGLVRPGAGAALVGSHQEIADRIEEYHALGVRHLILSGQPHLEEAYWFGEGVIPLLRARGLLEAHSTPAALGATSADSRATDSATAADHAG